MQLGRSYPVQAVRVRDWVNCFSGWLPVMGPQHEDGEIIGFPWQHFHIDWRFASARALKAQIAHHPRGSDAFVLTTPIMVWDREGTQIVMQGPVARRMTYKRKMPAFPRPPLVRACWPEQLQAKFACARLIDGRCPHRGIPVSAMRRVGDVLECPGHGLRWHAVTGRAIVESTA